MAKKQDQPAASSPRRLAALVALGAASALWAVFQWAELVRARTGGGSFCALSETLDCARVWDSPAASAVHAATGLPVAGWGLVWGLVALALPIWALVRRAEGKEMEAATAATGVVGGAGLAAVLALVGMSFAAGALCVGCLATYALVGAYGALALGDWRRTGFARAKEGFSRAGLATAAAFALLLFPGARTPRPSDAAGRDAVARAGRAAPAPQATPSEIHPSVARFASGPGTHDPTTDQHLAAFIQSLDPALRQTLSDSLGIFHSSPAVPVRPPRAVIGPKGAPVHITEFTDVQCGHCAQLDTTIKQLRLTMPDGFSLEARHFPLDGACNPAVQRRSGTEVSCAAAKARICVEGKEGAVEFGSALFAEGRALTKERILELGSKVMDRAALARCMASPETQAKLEDDVAWAMAHQLDGTPLVLVNGKKGTSFGPFLYAMMLTRGTGVHPAFASLPPPRPGAHVH